MKEPLARAVSVLIFAVAWLLACQPSYGASAEPEVVAQLVHVSAISSVATTPDGRHIVSASYDNTIKLWDIATGALVRGFEGHQAAIYSVAVTPDGRHIVSGSGDDTIRVWEATGTLIRSIACRQGAVISVAVTPDGRHIVSAGHVGSIKLWDLATGDLVLSFDTHQGVLTAMALTPDGGYVVSGGHNGTIKLWELATGKLVHSVGGWFTNHEGTVNSLAVTPDGRNIVSGSTDTTVKLWDVATGGLLRGVGEHEFRVNAVAVSSDDRYIVSESEDAIKLWDRATGALVRSVAGEASGGSIAIARDGLHIVLAGETIRLLELATGKLVGRFEGHQSSVNAVVATPDGRQIVSGNGDKTLKLWDPATGALLRSFAGHQDQVLGVAVTPDGRHVVSGSADDSIKLWDIATGELERTFEGHRFDVNAVVVTHDGRHIVSGSGDGSIKIWDLATGALVRDIESQQRVITSIVVTPDDRYILSLNYLGRIALWELATGALLQSWESNGYAMALTPDGRHVVSAGNAGSIDLWDIATGALALSFGDQSEGIRQRVGAIVVTPDGRHIVSSSSETTKLWDAATGTLVRSFDARQGPVNAIAMSPDGRVLFSGSSDGVLRIWDIGTGRALAALVGGGDGGALALTPHGFFLVDGEGKGAAYLKVVDRLDVYDVRQFYQALYRPELVSEVLRGDPEGKYEVAAGELNLRKILESGPAPRLKLKRTERVGDGVRVAVEIADQGGGIGKVEWRVDDVLLDGERGMTPLGEDESLLTDIRSFPLTAAGNVITITAYNKAGLITAVPVVEKVDGRGIADAEKSRLYILAIGINDYAQSSLRLNYAVNDAQSFSARLKTAAEGLGLFKAVSVRTLLDGDVTRERLDNTFTELAAEIGPEDKFVFFAAGHGKVYKDRYYFFPQDLRFGAGDAIISQGIDQDTWQTWFSRIQALASVLIYDTCEAGRMTTAMRGGESIRTAIDLLRHATGRSILAATTAEDAAREGFENHGVFTYALLRALSEGDQNDDGRIEVIELGQYVERTVPELTDERWGIAQRPRFTIQANFPIASRLAVDSGVAFIPRAPTHVIITQVTVASADRGTPADKRNLQPGTTVRLLRAEGDRALIARDGQELGFVPAEALAPLN
jgi:WD40 repeat protein